MVAGNVGAEVGRPLVVLATNSKSTSGLTLGNAELTTSSLLLLLPRIQKRFNLLSIMGTFFLLLVEAL